MAPRRGQIVAYILHSFGRHLAVVMAPLPPDHIAAIATSLVTQTTPVSENAQTRIGRANHTSPHSTQTPSYNMCMLNVKVNHRGVAAYFY